MNDQAKQYQQLIAKCWADKAFKQRLMANPREVLKQEGLEVPADISVQVVENTPTQMVLVVPQKLDELSDEMLGVVSGGCIHADVFGWYLGVLDNIVRSFK